MRDKEILNSINREEAISLLQDMIMIKTVNEPGDEKPLAEYIKNKLDEYGIAGEVDIFANNRANIVAKIKGKGERKSLLLNGHLDTVPPGDAEWEHDPFSGEMVNGKIYGRGSADMKGGLAAMISAVKIVKELNWNLKGDLILSGTAGEESDSVGAIKFVKDGGLEGVGAIVIGEPSSNGVNIAEKGAFWLEITTYGKTAHGAFPEEGINALIHMNYLISELTKYKFKFTENKILGHPTMNISTISGGVKTNVVPDKCTITIDVRTVPGMEHMEIFKDIKTIMDNLSKEIKSFNADVKIINDRKAVETSADNSFVKLAMETIKEEFGKDIKPTGVNFYTDASIFLPAKDIPCIFYGPGDPSMAHQPNEFVDVDSYIESIQFYCALIKKYLVI